MHGASDRPYCHWQRRIGPSSGAILNYSHTGRRLFSPCNCDVGRTPLTQLLHICLDILDEPLERRKKKDDKPEIKKTTWQNGWDELWKASERYRWSLLNTGPCTQASASMLMWPKTLEKTSSAMSLPPPSVGIQVRQQCSSSTPNTPLLVWDSSINSEEI